MLTLTLEEFVFLTGLLQHARGGRSLQLDLIHKVNNVCSYTSTTMFRYREGVGGLEFVPEVHQREVERVRRNLQSL